jgi:hypothetical protein
MNLQQGFLGQVPLVRAPKYLGEITDPAILAKVNMSEAFGNALTAVSKIAQITPDTMAASPETARMSFERFLSAAGAQALPYAMKLLVLASVLVKENIRALKLEPQQLSNILVGAETSIKNHIPAEQMPQELKKYQEEIISRASVNIQPQVRALIEGSGMTATNLVPNIPEGASRENLPPVAQQSVATPMPAAPAPGLSDLQKVALVGIPVILAAAIGFMIIK